MSSFFTKNRTLLNNHGWDVELICNKCGFRGQPRYEGWSQNLETEAGNAKIYAKVACPTCGRRLTDEAGRKLVELFSDSDIASENKAILSRFVAGLIAVPLVLAFVLFLGTQIAWWSWGLGSIWILIASVVSIPLLVLVKQNRIAQVLMRCECGAPHYIFMGSVDNAYCYRCFSCTKLLKLRE